MKRRLPMLIAGSFVSMTTFAQFTPSDLYQYNYTTVSPSFVGLEGQRMTFTGNVYAYKNGSYDGSGFIGYENKINKINSGVGFSTSFMSAYRQTATNMNLLYNYQWKIKDDAKLILGVKITENRLAFDHSNPGLPEPLALFGISSANTTLAGVSALYKRDKIFAGLSVDNLYHRTYKTVNIALISGFFDPQYNLIVGKEHSHGRIDFINSIYAIKKKDFWRIDFNNSMLIYDWIIVGVALEINNSDSDNEIYPKVNAGLDIKKKARFVFSIYSEGNNNGGKKFSGQMMILFNLQ